MRSVLAHMDAVHARSGAQPGKIVRGVVEATGGGGIVARLHRREADLNRAMSAANRTAVKELPGDDPEDLGSSRARLRAGQAQAALPPPGDLKAKGGL